jgi:hypothetical protein
MGEKLIIGPINKGLRTDREPFVIDNDSFPILINAYQWRGRAKRKRGTATLTRLQRIIGITDITTGNFTVVINPHPIQAGISVFMVGSTVFVDPDPTGSPDLINLITNNLFSTATLQRSTGELIITGGTENPLTNVIYFPALPVMGEEDWIDPTQAYPGTIGFDTTYAYNITTSFPYTPVDISFYKNPASAAPYEAKGTPTPLWWNGQNYQQFWTTNYQNAFWATNGLEVPFVASESAIGMQFGTITGMTISSATATMGPSTVVFTIPGTPLIIGDFVFINEVKYGAMAQPTTTSVNFQTGYVTAVAGDLVTVVFPNAFLDGTYASGGIAQYLTTRSDPILDCIRWYDGTGWVNFMPPLSMGDYVIDDSPQDQYYLVGAKLIFPFKDRLLFFGPVIQNSATGTAEVLLYLQDAIVYSQNGTPYYTASFTGDPLKTDTVFNAILVPPNQTATPTSYWEDQFGFGGNQPAGIDQAITTVSPNEDALITGFNTNIQTRVVYTGNDIQPFQFYIINAELGSGSTFSAVNMDEGVITRGPRGFIITSQTSCARIDLDILDQVFEISNQNNGAERFCSQRDFQNEWIYFTYNSDEFNYIFPNQSLQYNYRDLSWAIFNEVFTTYGTFRKKTGLTWATVGTVYPTWGVWNQRWGSGRSQLLQPSVIAGNQQGYIIERGIGTGEAASLYINNIVANVITSVNHCLNTGDYVQILNCLGTVGTIVNGKPFSIFVINNNSFSISNPNVGLISGTYLGGGTITRMYVPQIYSKQFPTAWELAKKTRIGVQQYLFTKTNNAQITLQIFLSTNIAEAFNNGPIVPDEDSLNDGLIYSNILFTCPESTNLGLTPANTNLQNLTAIDSSGSASNNQSQIWHRMNTSLIGDTVQFGFTLSPTQMLDLSFSSQFAEIEFHAAILDINPAGDLA